MTPAELALELGISDKTLRLWLRDKYPRAAELHGTSWQLTPDQVEAARARWSASKARNTWLFQANPSIFDLEADVRNSEIGTEGYWTVTRYGDEMGPGDVVIFWQAGKDAGIWAVGELTGPSYLPESPSGYTANPNERRVDYVYTQLLDEPLRKSELSHHPILKDLAVIQAPQGTNFRVTQTQWAALEELLPGRRWDEFVRWAQAFYEMPDFDDKERTYKIEIAKSMDSAHRAALERSTNWPAELGKAFGSPNNLAPWQAHSDLIAWAKTQPNEAIEALAPLWNDAIPVREAITSFSVRVPSSVRGGKGVKTNLASVLLLARDARENPPFRVTPVRAAYNLVRFPHPPEDANEGALYEHFLQFLDEFVSESAKRGLQLRDRLDAQSVMWAVTTEPPPEQWPQSRREALLEYRAGRDSAGPLARLVREFLDQTGYPTKIDQERDREREELAIGLTEEALASPDVKLMRRLAAAAYGSPGPQPLFMSLVGTEEGLEKVGNAFSHLLYGEGDVATRFDQILSDPEYAVAGLKEAILTKCLAVRRPDEWLPSYVSEGPRGKIKMLALLDLEPPDPAGSTGEIAYDTNRRLYAALDPFFAGDPWGMQAFLWWLLHREEESQRKPLAVLADELLIDLVHLEKIEKLLLDKKQVIFYGPPGTGKTYVAREFAALLAQSASSLEKVQFHPSYAYEDFVEGWRPTMVEGVPGFELRDGPLKRLARSAAQDPAGTYVLLIDEINRGNVAKIFGELYFLLEYRNEEMYLLYSDEPFTLPGNLLIIGTMNTADRSIALVDAALRRRFHFFPFFPDKPPIEYLLHRWLTKHKPELVWLSDVVNRANRDLGDSHNAIGPSHFMRSDLSEEWIELIWDHSVLPYIAEQFFGEEQRLAGFELKSLRKALSTNGGGIDGPTNTD